MQERTWRREPTGGGIKANLERIHGWFAVPRSNFMALEPDEYEDNLRANGASEHMIEVEMRQFRGLKHQQSMAQAEAQRRRDARKRRPVDEGLDEYVQAEIRRTSGVVADDVLEDLRRGR